MSTFQETCKRKGLLSDDGEWHHCLEEAAQYSSSKQLRSLFISILIHAHPRKPSKTLASIFKSCVRRPITFNFVRENVLVQLREAEHDCALHDLQDVLSTYYKKTLADFSLQMPQRNDYRDAFISDVGHERRHDAACTAAALPAVDIQIERRAKGSLQFSA